MMFWISPLLGARSRWSPSRCRCWSPTRCIGKRAQTAVRRAVGHTGELNGHIEEMYTGHALVKMFGRQREVRASVRRRERQAVPRPASAPSSSPGIIQPAMMFIGNLNYVLVAVVGGCGSPGRDLARRRAGLHPVLAPVHPAADPGGDHGQPAAVRASPRPSGCSSCSTPRSRQPDPADAATTGDRCAAGRVRARLVPLRPRPSADRGPLAGRRAGPDGGDRRARPAPARPRWSTCSCASTRSTSGRITLDGVDIATMRRDDLRVQHRHGAAGHLAVRRHDPREHRLRRRTPPRSEIVAAAQAAHVDRFVRTLPDGYETVHRRGGRQRQRRGEAAAHHRPRVPRRPVILILDEATSSVDTRTEVLIQRAMARCARAAPASSSPTGCPPSATPT